MNATTPTRPVDILLVEDNAGDVLLTREALAEGPVAVRVSVAPDGSTALDHLRRAGADRRLPDLVLLDLNLPGIGGLAVLDAIRSDPDLAHLPVIIVTSSTADADVLDAYRHHANSYVAKGVNAGDFTDALRGIESFWLSLAELPLRR